MALVVSVAPLLLLFQPCGGLAADLIFSGGLQRVGQESISVRLADGRLIDARVPNRSGLAPWTIASHYSIGDQVQITCQQIEPVWEEAASRYQYLELAKLRLLRPPSAEELSQILATRPWRGGANLLSRPSAADAAPNLRRADPRGTAAGGPDPVAQAKLEHVREVNLAYASNMPNFVADETAKRYARRGNSTEWAYVDTIESEIAFRGSRAVRQYIRKDGRPWDQPFQALSGFKWYGGFGTEIEPLFDPLCPTTVEYEGPKALRGKQLQAYRFSSPADGCFGPFTVLYQRYNPSRTGEALVDDPGGNVIQLNEEARGFPADFDFVQRNEEVSWDYVKIGDATHLLPVGADFVVRYSSGERWHVMVQYANHRHFESSTSITFH
jgi:hypothetical protein